MKVAVVYNRESRKVINLFGVPNREHYGLKAIKRITDALKEGGHTVTTLEGDKDLIPNLEDFMPRVLRGELPGLVFNLSYGIQGQARYTHVPGILEMVGIPYVGSGPLAHSLALDKVVAKMIFRQHGLPTPDFVVLDTPDFELPELVFPLIVKPKNEAVSFGIRVVENEKELREAAGTIFSTFEQPVLAEQFIKGREINVGLLGNNPPRAFPPAELTFGEEGPQIYTYEDKMRKSGREIGVSCPAGLPKGVAARAQDIAVGAFNALGCYDCGRVDMRLDADGGLYLLEINSLPSLGEHGSFIAAAAAVGMDFPTLVNSLVEAASARYFGTPDPPQINGKQTDPKKKVFSFITSHRDRMEGRLKRWCTRTSRTSDVVGRRNVVREVGKIFTEVLMKPAPELTNDKVVWTWETQAGLKDGALIICQVDIPIELGTPSPGYRRDPEWVYGEGVGSVWAPLTMLEYTLRALRSCRLLRKVRFGVLLYGDEGQDCRYSSDLIEKAVEQASEVIVLRPGNSGGTAIIERRGQRKYMLAVEGRPLRLGKTSRHPETLSWTMGKLQELSTLSSRRERVAVSASAVGTEAFPMLLPHRAMATILTSFPTKKASDELHEKILAALDKAPLSWDLEEVSNRPPMKTRKKGNQLLAALGEIAEAWDIPFATDSSVWPSAAGLVKPGTPVICGMGPVVRDLCTAREGVERISLIQRTLLLSQFLLARVDARRR
jgi:D-alanine-D-alanine ligase